MSALKLYAQHCRDLTPKETAALALRGIHSDVLGWRHGEQFAIKAAPVRWDGPWFDFASEGDGRRAAIIVCMDEAGAAADLAAWSPADERIALYFGNVAMIGEEQLSIPRLESDKLWIHASPADWLAHRRTGLVIANYDRAREMLAGCSPVAVKTPGLKALLEEKWRGPRIQVFDVGIAEAIAS